MAQAPPLETRPAPCPDCGVQAGPGARFCPRCGEVLARRAHAEADVAAADPGDGPGPPGPGNDGAAEPARRRTLLVAGAVAAVLVVLVAAQTATAAATARPGASGAVRAGPEQTGHFPGPAPRLDEVAWSVLVGPPAAATSWQANPRGPGRAVWDPWSHSASIADGTRLYTIHDEHVVAVDGATGRSLWRWPLPQPDAHGGLALTGPGGQDRPSHVVAALGGTVVALDAGTGEEAWRAEVGGDWIEWPRASESLVVVHVHGEARIVALAAESGAEIWSVDRPPHLWEGVAGIDGDHVVTVAPSETGSRVLVRSAADGRVLRTVTVPTGGVREVRGGRFFAEGWGWGGGVHDDGPADVDGESVDLDVLGEAPYLAAYDIETGDLLWSVRRPDALAAGHYDVGGGRSAIGDLVYLADHDRLRALDPATGATVWERAGEWGLGQAGAGADVLLATRRVADPAELPPRFVEHMLRLGQMAEIHGLDPRTGETLWRTTPRVGARTSVLGGPHAYVAGTEGWEVLDAASGATAAWHLVEPPVSCAPVVAGDAVVVPGQGAVRSVDLADATSSRVLRPVRAHEAATPVNAGRDGVAALVVDAGQVPSVVTHLYTDWGLLEPATVLAGRPAGPPVAVDGALYLAGTFREGTVVKIHRRSGRAHWRASVRGHAIASPTVSGGLVHVTTDHGVATLDAETGEPVWDARADIQPSHPAVRAGSILVVTGPTGAVAFDARSGRERWSFDAGAQVTGVAAARGRIYVGTSEGVTALTARSGAHRWTQPHPAHSSPAVAGGAVVVASGSELLALDAGSGRIRARTDVGTELVGDLAVVAGTVVGCSTQGRIVAVR